jgi:hypothetical protein
MILDEDHEAKSLQQNKGQAARIEMPWVARSHVRLALAQRAYKRARPKWLCRSAEASAVLLPSPVSGPTRSVRSRRERGRFSSEIARPVEIEN